MQREINDQANELHQINIKMFSDNKQKNEVDMIRKKIEVLQKKLRDRQEYIAEHKLKVREMIKLKGVY